jgi:hypothetical protein
VGLGGGGGGGGAGTRDSKLPGARAQSAGLIILALTSQGQVRDKVRKSQIFGKRPFDHVAGESYLWPFQDSGNILCGIAGKLCGKY